MVSQNQNTPPASGEDPEARRHHAQKLAEAAWIMRGFESSVVRPQEMPAAPRFPLGRTCATAALALWAEQENIDLTEYLRRHHFGDWGDLCDEDKAANEDALRDGARILSAYLTEGRKIYCITEADRSMTTILFAKEY